MLLGILNERSQNIYALFVLLIGISFLCGCQLEASDEEVETYLVEVNGVGVTQEEVMIYLYQVSAEFEEVGGESVWEFEDFSGGKSAVEVAKEAIIDNIIRIKVLKEKSVEMNINLSEDEVTRAEEEALEYLQTMEEEFVTENKITLVTMNSVFREFAIANKVTTQITDNVVPEEGAILQKMNANEEYARLINVDTFELLTELQVGHIILVIREKDQSGEYVSLTPAQKDVKYEIAVKIQKEAALGKDFEQLREHYSEEALNATDEIDGNYTFSKGLLPREFQSLSELEVGGVSEVIETDAGYHFFKVIGITEPSPDQIQEFEHSFDQFEEGLRLSVIQEFKNEAFGRLYNQWKEGVIISLDRETWELVSF